MDETGYHVCAAEASLHSAAGAQSSPQFSITTLEEGLPDLDPHASIAPSTSRPSSTSPKTVCFPSKKGQGTVVMKNCEPLVSGPRWPSTACQRGAGRRSSRLERPSIDARPPCVEVGKVTSLAHKLRDDTVEYGATKVERLATHTDTLLAGAERTEVLDSLWANTAKETKRHATRRFSINGDVKEAFGRRRGGGHARWFRAHARRDVQPLRCQEHGGQDERRHDLSA